MRAVLLSLSSVALLAACADGTTVGQASAPRAGFGTVAGIARTAGVGDPAWSLTPAEAAAVEARVRAMAHGRSIGADTAVQIALVNNRGLQAAYADLGLSAADLWEVALGPTPTLALSVSGLAGDVARSLEATLIAAVVEGATLRPRTALAGVRFRQAQYAAAGETVALAVETRRAWIEAVSAFEIAALTAEAKATADAGSELAAQLGRTGAMNAADQAREFAFAAELAAEAADARLEALLAKERLARLMGLSGSGIDFYVPDALPGLPGRPRTRSEIERLALANRVDLAAGRLEVEAIRREYRLTGQTRLLPEAAVLTGVEVEREDGETEARPTLEAEVDVPLRSTRALTSRRGELQYLRAANALSDAATAARSEARSAHMAVTGTHAIARQWRDEVLPLRRRIEEESLRSYSGMITSTFELIEDTRDGLEAEIGAAEAKRDYWLAETDVTAAIWGRAGGAGGEEDGDEE